MSVILTKQQIDEIKPVFINMMRDIFGTDISYQYSEDGTVDFELLGGDLNLSGTKPGGDFETIKKMVRDRVNTRILTTLGESRLLRQGYGSLLNHFVGVNNLSNNLETNTDIESTISAIIHLALEDEPYVTEINDVVVDIRDNSYFIDITYKSLFIDNMNAVMQIAGD